jgi:hypothetical protein
MVQVNTPTDKQKAIGKQVLRYKTDEPNPLDIVVLFSLSVFLIRMRPQIGYLSYVLGPKTQISQDALGGAIIGMSTLLVLAFFLIALKGRGTWAKYLKISIVCFFAVFFVVLPTISDMAARKNIGLRSHGRQVSVAHDGGVLQTEAAIKFILKGISPYSADYRDTEMKRGADSDPLLWKRLGFDENPAHHYYSYPPFALLLSIPFHLLSEWLFDWYDQRVVYLFAFVALGFMSYRFPMSTQFKLPFMTLLVLNPISSRELMWGMNDVLCLTFIVASILPLYRNQYRTSALMLGLACGLKQFAWVLVPFYLMYLFTLVPMGKLSVRLKALVRYAWPLFITLCSLFVPFLVWDPRGFFYSLITANAVVYPFRSTSLGFTNFLILFGWIEHSRDSFPNVIFYMVVVGPLSCLGLWRIAARKSLSSMVTWYMVTLLFFLFFSKHFAPNYFALLFSLMAITVVVTHEEGRRKHSTEDIEEQEMAYKSL